MKEPEQLSRSEPRNPHDSAEEFAAYYGSRHQSPEMIARFEAIKRKILAFIEKNDKKPPVSVLDIGCGAGAQAMLWAKDGYQVSALDINERLIELARTRAKESVLDIDFRLGSADALPWEDEKFDVCLAPELLEHVANWEQVLNELARVLKRDGTLFLSTTNALCPRQEEFSLPFYSWYPAPLKRYCERLAVTSHPQFVNHAQYPAVNWFTPYGLRGAFEQRGIRAYDRFDVLDVGSVSPAKKIVGVLCRTLPPLRFIGHCFTSGTLLFGVKKGT